MFIQLIDGPFRCAVVDDFYTETEVLKIKEEIVALFPYALPADSTNAAFDFETNKSKKKGLGIFLDDVFSKNRSVSKILTANRKLFTDEYLNTTLTNFDANFRHIKNCNKDTTLLNYYKNNEEYKSHEDLATLTVITFFKVGNFTGGDFVFPQYNQKIEFRENRMIIFPSCVEHQALSIQTQDNSYRVTIAQFLNYNE